MTDDPKNLPEAPVPGLLISRASQHEVVGVEVKMAGFEDGWIACHARLHHRDGTFHDMGWRSRSLAYALDMLATVARNYPNNTYLRVALDPQEGGEDGR